MSYSRWGSSVWYTYWCAHGGASADDKRDEQLFDICTVKMFTYKELKDDIDGCIDKVREIVDTANATNEGSTQITADEYKEGKTKWDVYAEDIWNRLWPTLKKNLTLQASFTRTEKFH